MGVLFTVTLIFALYSTFSVGGNSRGPICTFNISTSFASAIICCASVRLVSDIRLSGGNFLPRHRLCDCRFGGFLRLSVGRPGEAYVVCFSSDGGGLSGRTLGVLKGCGGGGTITLRGVSPRGFEFAGPRR